MNFKRIIKSIKYFLKINNSSFKKDFHSFVNLSEKQCQDFIIKPNYPCLDDKHTAAGIANGAYFHQDVFVARHIFNSNPNKHVDVGSRIDGFVAHVAVFREIEVYDIRPFDSKVKNIFFKQADFMSDEFSIENYCDSISSLHAIEHFGLGRYGDTIDPLGHIKGVSNITKMLKQGGVFYFSVPMGPTRIEFNAHRIFGLNFLIAWLCKDFIILEFSYVDDNCDIHENVELNKHFIDLNYLCNHGCAIFVLKKK